MIVAVFALAILAAVPSCLMALAITLVAIALPAGAACFGDLLRFLFSHFLAETPILLGVGAIHARAQVRMACLIVLETVAVSLHAFVVLARAFSFFLDISALLRGVDCLLFNEIDIFIVSE